MIVAWLLLLLGPYFRARGGLALGAVRLAIEPRRGRIADLVCFRAGARLPREGVVEVAPEIVVEVVSPRPEDERRDRIAKPEDYAALGARQYWIVDPWLRTLEVFVLDAQGRYVRVIAATGGVLEGIPELDGLTVDVDAMWSEIDRLPDA